MKPLVSYIIPVYNNDSYITDCLESIKDQRKAYPNIEIIVVDDGSTDNSYAYALSCLSNSGDPCEVGHLTPYYDRVLQLPHNMGVGHALNTGFAAAAGDYLCFFAADDVMLDKEKTFYQQLIMESTGTDLTFYLDWYEGESVRMSKRATGKWSYDWLPIGYLLKNYLPRNNWLFHKYLLHHMPVNSGSFMITKAAYKKYGKWNELVLTTDYDLLLRYCKMGAKIMPLHGAPMFYRLHEGQSSHRSTAMQKGIEKSRMENR